MASNGSIMPQQDLAPLIVRRNYTEQLLDAFPDFDNFEAFESLILKLPGSIDVTWPYNTSPSLTFRGLMIWVDYRDVNRREDCLGRQFDIWAMSPDRIKFRRVHQTDDLNVCISVAHDWANMFEYNKGAYDTLEPKRLFDWNAPKSE